MTESAPFAAGEPTGAHGIWRAAPASEGRRRAFIAPDFDDHDWVTVPTPGNWQSVPEFADEDGPLLYRSVLRGPGAPPRGADGSVDPVAAAEWGDADRRSWLVCDGIHNAADVWFDTTYLGPTDGSFVAHQFETTDFTSDTGRSQDAGHCVGIEVISSRPREPGSRARTFVGIYDDTETVGPAFNAGGIVGPVHHVATGPVRMWRPRLVNLEATSGTAVIRGSAELMSAAAREATIRTRVVDGAGRDVGVFTSRHHLSVGTTSVEWEVSVADPELWWPHQLGSQPLYEVHVTVLVDGRASDHHLRRMGFRTIDLRNWQMTVNGERLFVKGAVAWPTQRDLASAPADKIRGDVIDARDLGLDMLRVHTHVARPEFYAAADELGVLLWQDFPLRGRANRPLKDRVGRYATAMVDRLAHHPSIAMWCAHDDPTGTGRRPDRKPSTLRTLRRVVAQEAPSWNKSIMDRAISSAIESADPSRRVIPHSGAWPSPPLVDGTDTHLWFGWSTGTGRDIAPFARNLPRLMRWIGAFGAQSVPDIASSAPFLEPERWPDLNWSHLQGEFGLDRRSLAQFVPTTPHETPSDWIHATQDYQATLLRRQIEFLRRLKYRPTGGFFFHALADCRPAVSFAISDHQRRRKTAWNAVRAACAPVIVVADRLPSSLAPGEPVALDVHVVNDRRVALPTHRIDARLTWPGDAHSWTWQGSAAADEVVRVGMVSWMAPDAPGPVTLDLTMTDPASGDIVARNRYQSVIEHDPG